MNTPTPASELDNRLESNRKRLASLQNQIELPYDISTLKEKRKEKEDDLKHYKAKWFECMLIIEILSIN